MNKENSESSVGKAIPSSIVDKVLEERAKRAERNTIGQEERAEYKRCVNRLFDTPDGIYFLRKLIKYCGIYQVSQRMDAAVLIENEALRKLYFDLVRNYLDNDVKAKVEFDQ